MVEFGLPIRKDGYQVYQGKTVSLNLGGYNRKVGVVERITNEEFFLKPSLIIEVFPEGKDVYRIEYDTPSTHKRVQIIGIDPMREGYMEKLIEAIEKKKKKNILKHPRLIRNLALRLK